MSETIGLVDPQGAEAPFFVESLKLTVDQLLLIEKNMPFARAAVQKHVSVQSYLSPDTEQAAYLGLIEAAKAYDPHGTADFQSFAYPRIKGAAIDEIRSKNFLKPTQQRRVSEWRAVEDRLTQDLQRQPTGEEIKEELSLDTLNLHKDRIDNYKTDVKALADMEIPQSLEVIENLMNEAPALIDTNLPTEDELVDEIHTQELVAKLNEHLSELAPTQREVIRLHYLGGLAISQIAKDQRVTFQAVNQRKNRGLSHLADKLAA